ncbi:MAG: hypothetical protein AABX89_06685 [Candidatus Thermoplasmatota archaeon]
MRTGTAIVLALLIVLVVAYGVKGIGYFVLGVVAFALAIVLLVAVGIWLLRRKMKRRLRAFTEAVAAQEAARAASVSRRPADGRVIDVEPTAVRDASPPRQPGPPGQGP